MLLLGLLVKLPLTWLVVGLMVWWLWIGLKRH
ncbi:hypothetical protein KR100_10745 [Synechococcus sp. KORDI-100]|nr:hypothetical protein KR100_10745 [Synechococcus sp. KORDI-100]